MYRFFFLGLLFSCFQIQAQTSTEAVLKNGRAVKYYKSGTEFFRYMEPEENEYQQMAVAKVMNSFKNVSIQGYQRTDRVVPDPEDYVRSKTDDQLKRPPYFCGYFEFSPTSANENPSASKIYIHVEANVASKKVTPIEPFQMKEDAVVGQYAFTPNAKLSSFYRSVAYQGAIATFAVGDISLKKNASGSLDILGMKAPGGFLTVNNIYITICATPEEIAQIIESMNYAKLIETLSYKESWP